VTPARIVRVFGLLGLLAALLVAPIRMDNTGEGGLPGLAHVERIAQSYCAGQLPKIAATTAVVYAVDGALSLLEDVRIPIINTAPGKMLSGPHEAIRSLGNVLLLCTGLFGLGTAVMGMITFFCFKLLIPGAIVLRLIHECRPGLFVRAGTMARSLATGAILLWLFFPATTLLAGYVDAVCLDERLAEQVHKMEADTAELDAAKGVVSSGVETDRDLGAAVVETAKTIGSALNGLEQPGHVRAEQAQTLLAFRVALGRFAGQHAVDFVPVVAGGNKHFRQAEILVQLVESRHGPGPPHRDHARAHLVAEQPAVAGGHVKRPVQKSLQDAVDAAVVDRRSDHQAVRRKHGFKPAVDGIVGKAALPVLLLCAAAAADAAVQRVAADFDPFDPDAPVFQNLRHHGKPEGRIALLSPGTAVEHHDLHVRSPF
jgi:hypothetical protein